MPSSYFEIPPREDLKTVVKSMWVFEYDEDVLNKDYLLPSGLGYLFYMNTDKPFSTRSMDENHRSFINNGFYVGYLNSKIEFAHSRIQVVGASIYPIFLSLLFKGTPLDYENKFIYQSEINEKKIQCRNAKTIIQFIENYLVSKLDENTLNKEIFKMYNQVIAEKSYKISVEELANRMNYTTRHLNSLFKKNLGISPKRFIQLIRFNHAMEIMNHAQQNLNFIRIAHELGYHDQAHFVKDFKKMSGKTPKELFGEETLSKNFTLF